MAAAQVHAARAEPGPMQHLVDEVLACKAETDARRARADTMLGVLEGKVQQTGAWMQRRAMPAMQMAQSAVHQGREALDTTTPGGQRMAEVMARRTALEERLDEAENGWNELLDSANAVLQTEQETLEGADEALALTQLVMADAQAAAARREARDREREEAARAQATEVAQLQQAITKGQAQLAAIKDHLATLQVAAPTALANMVTAANGTLAQVIKDAQARTTTLVTEADQRKGDDDDDQQLVRAAQSQAALVAMEAAVAAAAAASAEVASSVQATVASSTTLSTTVRDQTRHLASAMMTVWRQVRAAEATAAEASAIAGAADDHDRVCRAAASLEAARRKLLSLGHGDVPELAEVAHAPHAVAAAVLAAARRRVDDDRTRSGPHVKTLAPTQEDEAEAELVQQITRLQQQAHVRHAELQEALRRHELACINDHKLKTGGTAPPPLVLDHEAAALMPPRDEATRTLLTASLRSAPSDPVKALLADIERNEGVDAILAEVGLPKAAASASAKRADRSPGGGSGSNSDDDDRKRAPRRGTAGAGRSSAAGRPGKAPKALGKRGRR